MTSTNSSRDQRVEATLEELLADGLTLTVMGRDGIHPNQIRALMSDAILAAE